jgi:hypothetical protein
MACNSLKVNRRFGYSPCHLLSRWFLAQLILRQLSWRGYAPPKRRFTFNWLQGVISQKKVPFITSNLITTKWLCKLSNQLNKWSDKNIINHPNNDTGAPSSKSSTKSMLWRLQMHTAMFLKATTAPCVGPIQHTTHLQLICCMINFNIVSIHKNNPSKSTLRVRKKIFLCIYIWVEVHHLIIYCFKMCKVKNTNSKSPS